MAVTFIHHLANAGQSGICFCRSQNLEGFNLFYLMSFVALKLRWLCLLPKQYILCTYNAAYQSLVPVLILVCGSMYNGHCGLTDQTTPVYMGKIIIHMLQLIILEKFSNRIKSKVGLNFLINW